MASQLYVEAVGDRGTWLASTFIKVPPPVRQIGSSNVYETDNGALVCQKHGDNCEDIAAVIRDAKDAWDDEDGPYPVPARVEVLLFKDEESVAVDFDDPDENGFYKWDLERADLSTYIKVPELHGYIKPDEGRRSIRQEIISWLIAIGYSEDRWCRSNLHGAVVPDLERARVGATNKAFIMDTYMIIRWGKCFRCVELEAALIPEV